MDEPWLRYQPQQGTDEGPWKNYAQPKEPEKTYGQKVEEAGQAFDKAVGGRTFSEGGLKGLGKTAVAAGEVGLSALTGVAGDIAGAATSVLTQDPERGKAVRSAITTEPATEAGKAAQKYVGAITEPVAKVVEAVPKFLEEHGHPILSQASRAAIDVAGGRKALETKEATTATKVANADLLSRGRAAGYVFKPSEAGGKVGKVAEGVTGSPRLSIEGSLKNQPVTDRLAATEIGVEGKITKASLAKAKQPHSANYKAMGDLGDITTTPEYKSEIAGIGRTPGKSFQKHKNPEVDQLRSAFMEDSFNAKDAVLKVRQLRNSSMKNIKSQDPVKNELGYAERKVADAIDNELERAADAQGKTDLAASYRESRKQLAKIHNVETAMVGNTGNVSATRLAKMQQKGVPLTGNLKLIADMADEYGEVMRDATKLKNKVPITVLEGGAGVAGGVMTAMHSPHIGIPLLMGMAARPLARKALLSEAYQNKLAKQHTVKELE